MLTPEYLLRISEGSEEIADRLHSDILNAIVSRIVIRMNRGEDYILTSRDKWQIETLQEAGFLLEDIQKEIAKRTKQQEKEIAEAFEEAGVKTLEWDDKVYKAAGLSPVSLVESPYMIRLMQQTYDATIGEWVNFTGTMAIETQNIFIRALDDAYIKVASGSMSYTEAYIETIDSIIANGVIVEYPSGHKDTIETAVLRAVRTGINQMSARITDARMKEMNWDIILVSAHLGARYTGTGDYRDHQWWQGKFYSKSGRDPRFPPYSVLGEGNVQGIHGANCRHSKGPGDGEHNPFQNFDTEENRKTYETQQHQRVLERRIRNTKRQTLAYQTAMENATDEKARFELVMRHQRKAYLLERQNKVYAAYCEEKGVRRLDERLKIAKWSRKEAAAARGAAQRYKNARGIK